MAIVPLNPSNTVNSQNDSLPHVLLVVDQFAKTLGGGERALLQLASLLPAYGFRASILTFLVHPESPALRMATSPIYLLRLHRVYDLEALRGAFELREFLKEREVRIVQTFFESSDLWAGFVTRISSDAKLVWSRRDMGILRSLKHRIGYRLMAGLPDAVFAVSEKVREYCIREDHLSAARVYTIHNGLHVNRFAVSRNGFHKEAVVTSVGNVRRVKGHDLFIRAAAVIAQRFPHVRFSIAGEVLETEYFEELRQLIETLGLSQCFRFEGGVTDLPRFLEGADIFVLPSRSEGFSNAIVEAMAASLPVVATRVGGNPEAVKDGITGIVVPPEDPTALADAVLELLEDPERSRAMGEAGRHVAMREFSADSVTNRVVDIYRRLLSLPPEEN
jgi:glycosyltransferase involved in cell wall biosynthesis